MNRTKHILLAALLFGLPFFGHAQKGVGNQSGIARGNSVEIKDHVSGSIQEIINEPCTQTTGRFSKGSHLLVKTEGEESNTINVHLGPTSMVSGMTDQMNTGQLVDLTLIKTEDLPDNHYIAKELSSGNNTYELRDDNLRPFWANNRKEVRR